MKRTFLIVFWVVFGALAEAMALPLNEALAMFESGATQPLRCAADRKRGHSGEVSRYQIMPEIWRQYSRSREYENPLVAWSVAERILQSRIRWFRDDTGRDPNALELYLLWNKPGHFRAVNYKLPRVNVRYKERAQRFSHLCEPTYVVISMISSDGFRRSL